MEINGGLGGNIVVLQGNNCNKDIIQNNLGGEPISPLSAPFTPFAIAGGGNLLGASRAISSGTVLIMGGDNITVSQVNNSLKIFGLSQQIQSSLLFVNANNVSFTTLNGSLLASASYPTQAPQTQYNFINSNGFVFGSSGSNVTVSYTNPIGGSIQISASNSSLINTGLSFGNGNGLSFYFSNGSIVGSYTSPSVAGLLSALNISANNSSTNLTNLFFQNSNGISFGINGSVVTASVQTNYQSQGAYLTTAMLSNASSVFAGINGAITGGSITLNTSGFSINLPNYLTTAMASNASSAFAGTGAAITGGSITNNTAGISINLPAYLTTFNQSNQNISLYGLGNTTQNSSTLLNASNLSFNAIGSITLGFSNGSIQLSAPNALTSQSNQALSGSNGSFAFQTATFGNLNGFSFYTSNGSMVGSYTVPTIAGFLSNINISAGSTSNNLSAFTFNNGGGVSFGLNGSVITASVAAAGGAQTGISGISGGTTQMTSGTAVFSNSNGVTFGVNGNTITASVQTNYQSQGAYLTTAMQSNAATISNINISAGTTSQNLSNFVFSNSNGVGFGLNGSTITASQSTLVYSNSNNITFGINGSTLTASASFAQTNQNISLYALGNTTQNSSTLLNASNLSFNAIGSLSIGYSNGSIQFSAPNAITSQSNQAFSASGGSSAFQTLNFANSNGFTFSNSNGSVIGSYTVPSITGFAGINSAITGGSMTLNTSGLSVNISQSNPNISFYVTGNSTQNSSSVLNANSILFNGLGVASLGFSNGSIVLSVPSGGGAGDGYNIIAAGGSTANTTGTIVFSNSNNMSFGLNGSIVTGSFSQSAQLLAASGSNGSFNFSTLSFGNLNGLSFYSSNSSIVGSYTVPTQSNQDISLYALGNTTQNSSTVLNASVLSFNGLGNISVGFSNGSIQLSGTGGGGGITNINVSAGTTSQNLSNFVFSNANKVSFGLNNSTITASYALPTMSMFDTPTMASSTYNGIGQSSISIMPMYLPMNLSASAAAILANITAQTSSNNTMQGTLNIVLGVYSLNGVSLSLASSGSQQYTYSFTSTQSSAIMSGIRRLTVPFNINATPGNYWYGVNIQTATANTSNGSMNVSVVGNAGNMSFNGDWTMATNVTSMQILPFVGNYSAISAAMPSNIQKSEMRGSGGTPNRFPWIGFFNF